MLCSSWGADRRKKVHMIAVKCGVSSADVVFGQIKQLEKIVAISRIVAFEILHP